MDPPVLRSAPFRLDRRRFAQAATRFYVRRYWPFYAASIVAGLVILALQRDAIALFVAAVLIAYPLTVPVRYSNAIGARAAGLFGQDLEYLVHPGHVEIRNAEGGTVTAQFANVRQAEEIGDTIVLQFGRAHFLVLPLDALDPGDRAEFVARVRRRGVTPPA